MHEQVIEITNIPNEATQRHITEFVRNYYLGKFVVFRMKEYKYEKRAYLRLMTLQDSDYVAELLDNELIFNVKVSAQALKPSELDTY